MTRRVNGRVTNLDLRDLRRAKKIVAELREMHRINGGFCRLDDILPLIAAALKAERRDLVNSITESN